MRILLSIVLALGIAVPTKADIVSDVWGIMTDPLKFKSGSENTLQAVREARDAIVAMEKIRGDLDDQIMRYLEDIDQKIEKIDDAAEERIEQIANEIRDIEKRIVTDILSIMHEAECVGVRLSDEAIRNALRDALPVWLEGNTSVIRMPFGTQQAYVFWDLIPWGEEPRTVVIDLDAGLNPYEIFKTIEDGYLESLSNAHDGSEAYKIIVAYGELARLARKYACFYKNQRLEERLVRRFNKYNAIVYAWENAVLVEG